MWNGWPGARQPAGRRRSLKDKVGQSVADEKQGSKARQRSSPNPDPFFATTLDRGLKVLSAFGPDDAWLSNSEISSRTGMPRRSEEHTSELQSLMRISYAVFCLKKKNTTKNHRSHTQ